MHAGRIVQVDEPEQVFHAPVSRFVAAFMGEADFVTRSEAGALADERWGATDADATVMLRPDDITFMVEHDGGARVTGAEFRGSVWCYTLELATGATVHSVRSHLDHVAIGTVVAPRVRAGHRPVVVPDDDRRS